MLMTIIIINDNVIIIMTIIIIVVVLLVKTFVLTLQLNVLLDRQLMKWPLFWEVKGWDLF